MTAPLLDNKKAHYFFFLNNARPQVLEIYAAPQIGKPKTGAASGGSHVFGSPSNHTTTPRETPKNTADKE
jgi:hypothetical protein